MTKAIRYPSTAQFRQVIRTMHDKLTFDGIDEEGNIKRKVLPPEAYLIPYIGTVKLHGTNGSVVFHSEDEVVFQSKERVVTVGDDNNGFAAFMSRKDTAELLSQVKYLCEVNDVEFQFPVEIAGEWAGRGIQKGVAITEVEPFFAIFRVAVGRDEATDTLNWLPPTFQFGIGLPDARIYSILDFGYWMANIPFNEPELVQNDLAELTREVENKCPAGKFFGVEGIGEGIVWSPKDPELSKISGLWFKVKGDKHSVSKVKTLAAIDPERLASMREFVEYAVTEARLEQGVSEVGLDQTKIGEFIGWINRDINKEEGDVLEASSMTMKDVGKFISNKARAWYMTRLSEEG
ncbi:RNA ligase [Klebsiella phage vB_KpnM_NDO71]|nr:RNA ligase [Klebsiella phage vB_KpnM_NDO71]